MSPEPQVGATSPVAGSAAFTLGAPALGGARRGRGLHRHVNSGGTAPEVRAGEAGGEPAAARAGSSIPSRGPRGAHAARTGAAGEPVRLRASRRTGEGRGGPAPASLAAGGGAPAAHTPPHLGAPRPAQVRLSLGKGAGTSWARGGETARRGRCGPRTSGCGSPPSRQRGSRGGAASSSSSVLGPALRAPAELPRPPAQPVAPASAQQASPREQQRRCLRPTCPRPPRRPPEPHAAPSGWENARGPARPPAQPPSRPAAAAAAAERGRGRGAGGHKPARDWVAQPRSPIGGRRRGGGTVSWRPRRRGALGLVSLAAEPAHHLGLGGAS